MGTLSDFLSTGACGTVRLGMTSQAVQQVLGLADDRSVMTRPLQILKFGSSELAFQYDPELNDSRLVSIALYFSFPNRLLPAALLFDDFTPSGNTSVADFQDYLSSTSASFRLNADEENTYLTLDSGGSVVFVDDQLHSIHFHRAYKVKRRQVSVSLPVETVTNLQIRAERENISVKELIQKVLSNSA